MKILFVHQNFPGQYLHLLRYLASIPGNEIVFITQREDGALPGVNKIVYRPHREVLANQHHYLRTAEEGVLNAQAVARVALKLKQSGFVPDLMLGHNGWGEIWYLKDIFPHSPLLGYFEFFYRLHGADVGFDPDYPVSFDTAPRVRTKNIGNFLGLDACDLGQSPTRWQKSRYPASYQPMLKLLHDGINTTRARPDMRARVRLQCNGNEIELSPGDEVLTYVARNLEPYRGFPNFMRSLPAILAARPQARVLIVGGDGRSYGTKLPDGESWRQKMLAELGDSLDLQRVHFLGALPYEDFLQVLQVSRAHVYLTYPFVLSWSMLEAMAAECLLIGSRTAPVEEVIQDGENGLLVDFFKPEEIAGRVIDALANPRAYSLLRKNARQTIIERYDLQKVALPAQIEVLQQMLASR